MATPLAKPGWIEFLGQPMLFSDSITDKFASGDKPKMTNLLGVAGHSDGAGLASYDVKGAVPQAGFEFDAKGYASRHETIVLVFKIAGYRDEVEGRVEDVSVSTSAEGETEQSFSFNGALLSHQRIS